MNHICIGFRPMQECRRDEVYPRPLFLSSASVEISIATVDINRRRVEEIYSPLLFCLAPGTFPFKDDS